MMGISVGAVSFRGSNGLISRCNLQVIRQSGKTIPKSKRIKNNW